MRARKWAESVCLSIAMCGCAPSVSEDAEQEGGGADRPGPATAVGAGGGATGAGDGGQRDDGPIVLAAHLPAPQALARVGQTIYATCAGTEPARADGAVVAVDLDGGPLTTVASSQPGAAGLAADDARVVWTRPEEGLVMTRQRACGAPAVLASALPGPLAVGLAAGRAFVTTTGPLVSVDASGAASQVSAGVGRTTPNGLAVGPDFLVTGASLARFTLEGGPLAPLDSWCAAPPGLAIDGSDVFAILLDPYDPLGAVVRARRWARRSRTRSPA